MRVFYRHTFNLIIGIFLNYSLCAQCTGDPEPALACESAPIFCSYSEIDDYCFKMTEIATGNVPIGCPQSWSAGAWPNWLSFYAECTELHLIATQTGIVLQKYS